MSLLAKDSECVRILEDNKTLSKEEKHIVAIILHNMIVRGMIVDDLDEVIATTECIVLTNCLREIQNSTTVTDETKS